MLIGPLCHEKKKDHERYKVQTEMPSPEILLAEWVMISDLEGQRADPLRTGTEGPGLRPKAIRCR